MIEPRLILFFSLSVSSRGTRVSERSELNCRLKTSSGRNETMFPVCRAAGAPGGIRALFIFPFAGGPREEEITLSLVSAPL